jgi:hypothetical protein
MKSSLHSLIPFFPFLLNYLGLPSPELELVPFRLLFCTPCDSASSTSVLPNTSYNRFVRTPRKTPSSIVKNACFLVRYLAMEPFYCRVRVCCGNMFTDPLPSNVYTRIVQLLNVIRTLISKLFISWVYWHFLIWVLFVPKISSICTGVGRGRAKQDISSPWISETNNLKKEILNYFWLRAGRPRGRSLIPGMIKNFLFSMSSRPALGPTQHSIQWVLAVISLGIKRSVREADNSPPSSAEVKKTEIYTSTPPYVFMA